MTAREAADTAREARERLTAWVDDIVLGRYEWPQYPNVGQLKADVRLVVAAAERAETLRDATQAAWGVLYALPVNCQSKRRTAVMMQCRAALADPGKEQP